MKPLVLLLSAPLFLEGCSVNRPERLVAADSTTNDASTATTGYVQSASSADVFEVQAARLALQRSRNPSVRSFAQMLLNDHTQLLDQLGVAAQSSGAITTGGTMLARHSNLLTQLEASSPSEFDSAYRNIEVTMHLEASNLHQQYAASGDNAALRRYAQGAWPILRSHLGQARSLAIPPPSYPTLISGSAGERG